MFSTQFCTFVTTWYDFHACFVTIDFLWYRVTSYEIEWPHSCIFQQKFQIHHNRDHSNKFDYKNYHIVAILVFKKQFWVILIFFGWHSILQFNLISQSIWHLPFFLSFKFDGLLAFRSFVHVKRNLIEEMDHKNYFLLDFRKFYSINQLYPIQ